MQLQEFIRSACEKIQSAFPYSKVEYQYKSISDTHFIKVTPSSIFDEERFIDLDFELTENFESQFTGDLCFLKDDSLSELEAPTMIFEPISTIGLNSIHDEFYKSLESKIAKIEFSFETTSKIDTSFEALQNYINSVVSNFKTEDFDFSNTFEKINFSPSSKDSNLLFEELSISIIDLERFPEKETSKGGGNNNYAMAA